MFQEVIMFEVSVSHLFSILHGRSQGCDEGHLRFPISATLKRNLIIENTNVISVKESGSASERNMKPIEPEGDRWRRKSDGQK